MRRRRFGGRWGTYMFKAFGLKLEGKIIASATLAVVLCAAAITGVTVYLSRQAAEDSAIALVDEVAQNQGGRIRLELAEAIERARAIANLVQSEMKAGDPRRAVVNHMIRHIAEQNPGYAGTWLDMAPNAFDGRDADFSIRDERAVEILGLPNTGRMSLLWLPDDKGVIHADDGEGLPFEQVAEKEYYKSAATARKEVVTEPYLDDMTKLLMASAVVPVMADGRVVGVAGLDFALSSLTQMVNSQHPLGTGYLAVISSGGLYAAHPDNARRTKAPDDLPDEARKAIAQGKGFEGHAVLNARDYYLHVQPLRFGKSDASWSLLVAVPTETVMAEASRLSTVSLLVGLVGIVLVSLVAWAVGRGIARPVKGMTSAMAVLAGGDLSVGIPAMEQDDEVGEMARAVDVFKRNMLRARELDAQQRREWAEREARAERLAALQLEFESRGGSLIESLAGAAAELETTARNLTAIAEQTTRQSVSVAACAEQSTTNVQTVAAATEELTASIGEIRQQVAESARIAEVAVADANRTDATVEALAVSADRIGDVVNLIQDIASQTNLLALNATIEAARAGEAGKGFSVVANEVKHLANQTARATEEIVGQIDEIRGIAGQSVESIQAIGHTIEHLSEIAAVIASAVVQQGGATSEIAANIHQAASGTRETADRMAEIQQGAGHAGSAAGDVLSAAARVARQSEELNRQMRAFLDGVKAA